MTGHTEMHEIQNKNGSKRGATLAWRNVNVFIKDKRRRGKDRLKQIISNSTGSIGPGTLMAVMGARYVIMIRFVYFVYKIDRNFSQMLFL